MLVQSHACFLHVLPALPAAWTDGEVKGLRARGGFEISEMKWRAGKVVSVKIKSTLGGNLRLRTATALDMNDGSALTMASGDNSNALVQPYVMPDPIVADASKIPATSLPSTYLYDIPTTVGQEIELISRDASSAIITIEGPDQLSTRSSIAYSIDGRRVGDSYRGLVIMNGKKYFRK